MQRSLLGCGLRSDRTAPEEVRMAPPSSTYCQICQEKFQDYFAHIRTRPHLLREANAEASAFILELCASLAPPDDAPPSLPRAKPIRKEKREERPAQRRAVRN